MQRSLRPVLRPIPVDPAALIALHAAQPDAYPALLQSAAVGDPLGRFDILFARPRASLTLHDGGELRLPDGRRARGSFLDALDAWRAREQSAADADASPFIGGWLLYLGYELAGEIEPRLRLPRSTYEPIAAAVRIPAAIVYRHASREGWVVAEGDAAALIEPICADVAGARPLDSRAGSLIDGAPEEDEPAAFIEAVERALGYIAAGDVYQANLSRAWRAQLREGVRAVDVYNRLRTTNPGPFSAIARLGELTVVSSSPERLVEVRGREVSTRPIAGTRPRGTNPEADRALIAELRAHPKERAEHVMLIDLERNDLGRVCEAGSVRVDEYMTIESYAHVHHIVSNVRGRLRSGASTGQVLRAVFPGGTITGCPKIRCMEIIAELEGVARGPYTGALGYLNVNGDMDLNILIRTLALQGGAVSVRAGAGIVADSIPARELAETRAKARGVLRALDGAFEAP